MSFKDRNWPYRPTWTKSFLEVDQELYYPCYHTYTRIYLKFLVINCKYFLYYEVRWLFCYPVLRFDHMKWNYATTMLQTINSTLDLLQNNQNNRGKCFFFQNLRTFIWTLFINYCVWIKIACNQCLGNFSCNYSKFGDYLYFMFVFHPNIHLRWVSIF
jgi:hypothetical protein